MEGTLLLDKTCRSLLYTIETQEFCLPYYLIWRKFDLSVSNFGNFLYFARLSAKIWNVKSRSYCKIDKWKIINDTTFILTYVNDNYKSNINLVFQLLTIFKIITWLSRQNYHIIFLNANLMSMEEWQVTSSKQL